MAVLIKAGHLREENVEQRYVINYFYSGKEVKIGGTGITNKLNYAK